ncbi:glycoside hydrolase family 88/105 protein [Geofilum rhodophaeum]|uniref:glycoside hydrolase family 88/105 protein n=1 Tax=Geofilum rhodophaeum TaxID=1965019 RepID=UPI000B5275E8|nr:glycoside hydrolase family 88 protein [Geofilum rhodophaeum]
MKKSGLFLLLFVLVAGLTSCQSSGSAGEEAPLTDANTPLHLLQPDYTTPYRVPEKREIIDVLDRVYGYLSEVTPMGLVDRASGAAVSDYAEINENTIFEKGDFRLTSYEWGVTYAGMLLAAEVTGDQRYANYTYDRLKFLAEIQPYFLKLGEEHRSYAMHSVIHPGALDDSGALCAAMIKAKLAGQEDDLDALIDNFMAYISNGQFRLEDGTLARNRPMRNSLWLDDLFMSVPALAYMGHYSGDDAYFDDAVKQVLQFSGRMFNESNQLFMHGWIQDMEEHPQFHWARANGWAVMTMVELLEVLPENYAGRAEVLALLQKHIRGLANHQGEDGFWHQLIDRNDSYLETSATAIYVYAIARAINRGYVDAQVYGPMVTLAWNAVAGQVNEKGQVEGTCVGTGMGFDPSFYYYRPISVYAAHGYGPVLLAGAEMLALLEQTHPRMNDSAIIFFPEAVQADGPIFELN